jgi:hypothetical protein
MYDVINVIEMVQSIGDMSYSILNVVIYIYIKYDNSICSELSIGYQNTRMNYPAAN